MQHNSGIKLCILGLGSIGQRHAHNARDLGCEVFGFDPDRDARKRFEAEFGQKTLPRDEALDACEAVVIASPNQFHLDDLTEVIGRRKPVLVEKPLGHDPSRAAELIQQAEAKGIMVAAAQNLRFRKSVRAVKEWLNSGAIGDCLWARLTCGSYLPDWRPHQDYRENYASDPETGGVIFDVIHELDLACHLLGPARLETAVAVHTGTLSIGSEDISEILLRHDNGCLSSIHVDYVTRTKRRDLDIVGTKGAIRADLRSGRVELIPAEGGHGRIEELGFVANDEYSDLLKDFILAVQNNTETRCPGQEALKVLGITARARKVCGLPQMGVPEDMAV